MSHIAWNDQYLLGIPMIDNQHKYLFKLFSTLYEDSAASPSADYPAELFDNLVAYASYHFSLEERWMKSQGYPLFHEHRLQHANFSRQMVQMQWQYTGQGKNVSLKGLNILYNWLVTHIQGSDSDFGGFIQQQGYHRSWNTIAHERRPR